MIGLLICLMYCGCVRGVAGYTGNDVDALMTQLFTTNGYNNKVRSSMDLPRVAMSSANKSNIKTISSISNPDSTLLSVIEFDEQDEVLKTAGYLYIQWQDQYLSWIPSSYNNTDKLFVPQDDIWKPDVSLRNTFKTFTGLGSSYLNVIVTPEGYVTWYPFQILESTCAVDITYFPFDKQLCDIKFTAWSYQKTEVDLNAGSNGVTLDEFSPNAQWKLTDTKYEEINTGEAAVIFQIELTRKSSFYVINVIMPVILLSVLNICTFLLPVASGEKAGYSITVFLSLAVFLTIIASELPKNSDVVSLMSVYLTLMALLSTFIVVVCLIQIRLSVRSTSDTPINRVFLFLIKLSMIMRCQKCSEKISPSSKSIPVTERDTEKQNKSNNEKENVIGSDDSYNWTDVIDAIDYLFFWLSLLFTFLCTTIIFGISVNN
ncbi:acetylcholine receptor subunit beta-type lev-1-like [Mercenaria mercenaria]|uniref:acetylcholine receptor subunit beta-type lev-1-like n=1 Tax=Mercenaria mercenaria TaxID=6596 RepID=UPI00234F39BC|nr:acetylcholine receptor subunit beta-type lev-1-like [Mercenaria mercenaria]